jgi:hypothetical protein
MGNSIPPTRGKSTEVRIEKSSLEAAFKELETIYFIPLGLKLSELEEVHDSLAKL